MESIKTYKAILLAVGGIVIVLGGAYWYMKDAPVKEEPIVKAYMRTIEGQVTRMFEGENKIVYSFDIPEEATSTTGMGDALIKVMDNGAAYVSMYFSFEGGRGFLAEEYIKHVIVPRVPALTIMGTTTIGSYEWLRAESAASEWYVAQVGDGQWLLVVESKKALHDQVMETLESLTTE